MLFRNYRFLISLSMLLFIASACSIMENKLHSIEGFTMGTTYSIKINNNDLDNENTAKLKKEVDSVLAEINREMSTYQADSEITLFNKSEDTTWTEVSKDFVRVIKLAQKISNKSGGAFDVTVGPLVNLWGFGPGNSRRIVPLEKEITKAKKAIGYKYLQVNDSLGIKKNIPQLYIDLSAIAKGYGVDKISEFLLARGYNNHLVEIGGEVRTAGVNHKNNKWQIGVQTPDNTNSIQKVLNISDIAVATSGDYRNYFEKDGIRYSHTIDSRSGKPITHKLASVSVMNSSCGAADAYATAIMVLGPEEGYSFAIENKLDVMLIIKSGSSFKVKTTPGFEKYLDVIE